MSMFERSEVQVEVPSSQHTEVTIRCSVCQEEMGDEDEAEEHFGWKHAVTSTHKTAAGEIYRLETEEAAKAFLAFQVSQRNADHSEVTWDGPGCYFVEESVYRRGCGCGCQDVQCVLRPIRMLRDRLLHQIASLQTQAASLVPFS